MIRFCLLRLIRRKRTLLLTSAFSYIHLLIQTGAEKQIPCFRASLEEAKVQIMLGINAQSVGNHMCMAGAVLDQGFRRAL